MAFESVNVSALKGELSNLSSTIPNLQKGISAPFEELNETNWKSEVRTSTVDKVSKISEKFEEVKASISAYQGILDMIADYKVKKQEYETAFAKYKSYKSQYEATFDGDTGLGDLFARWTYEFWMNHYQKSANDCREKMNALLAKIEGASI